MSHFQKLTIPKTKSPDLDEALKFSQNKLYNAYHGEELKKENVLLKKKVNMLKEKVKNYKETIKLFSDENEKIKLIPYHGEELKKENVLLKKKVNMLEEKVKSYKETIKLFSDENEKIKLIPYHCSKVSDLLNEKENYDTEIAVLNEEVKTLKEIGTVHIGPSDRLVRAILVMVVFIVFFEGFYLVKGLL
jgi:chromosome segregation ATPase